MLRNWGLVFLGNFAGAVTVAFMKSFIFTYGYNTDGGDIAAKVSTIDESRTLGYRSCGVGGWVGEGSSVAPAVGGAVGSGFGFCACKPAPTMRPIAHASTTKAEMTMAAIFRARC